MWRRVVAAGCGVLVVAGIAVAPPVAGAAPAEPVLALAGPPERAPAGPCECSAGTPPRAPVPVRLYSGELYHDAVDMRIVGRGVDFVWSRTYRSRVGPNSAAGAGWDFSYNISVAAERSDLVLHDGGGRADRYARQPDGTYAAQGFFRTLRANADGTYMVAFPDGSSWWLRPLDGSPAAGKVATIRDRNGNGLAFTYDSAGRLDFVTDSLDRRIDVGYGSDGHIESLVDFTGRRVTYTHYRAGDAGGGSGDLRSTTSPAVTGTPNGNDFPGGKTTTYTYATGQSDERLNHNLTSITNPRGRAYLSVVYGSGSPGVLGFDRVSTVAWGDAGDTVELVYVPATAPAALKAIVNDRVGNVSEYWYDGASRLLTRREFTGRADPDRPTTETENRPAGRLRATDPLYFETRWDWNADSLPVRMVRPEGDSTERAFEGDLRPGAPAPERGNLRTERFLPGPLGGDQPFISRRYEYRGGLGGCCDGELATRVTDGRGAVTTRSYDVHGNLLRTTGPAPDMVTDYAYDEFGRQTSQTWPGNGAGGGGSRRVDRFVYGADGYLAQEIVDADHLRMTTSYEREPRGNVRRVVDPRGYDTLFEFNQLDQVVREQSAIVDGIRHRTDHYRDANDNVVRVFDGSSGLSTRYAYGTLDEVTRVTREVTTTYAVTVEYGYDANRNVVLERSGEATSGRQPGNVVRTAHDERDRLFQRTAGAGSTARSTTRHDYDGNGRLVVLSTGLEAGARARRHSYDGYGRVSRTVDPMGNTTSYGYDANGNTTSVRIDGELVDGLDGRANVRLSARSTGYDAANRPVREDVAFFDPTTQQPIGDGLSTTRWVYNGLSTVVGTTDDNGHLTTTGYDTANRQRVGVDALGNTISVVRDGNGNMVQAGETDAGGGTLASRYAYDGLNRLVEEMGPTGPTRYTYDPRGNRTSAIDPLGNVVSYAYDGLDRLLTTTRGTLLIGQTWDDNGRRTSQRDPNGNVTAYRYDELDREVVAAFADGTAELSGYDAHGDRIRVQDPTGTVVREDHDALGRLTGRAITAGPGVVADTTAESYRFDGASRLVRAVDDDSTVERRYDSMANLTTEGLDGRTTVCRYTAVGTRSGCTYPGGRPVEVSRDDLGRPQRITEGADVIAAYEYEGPLRVVRRTRPGTTVASRFGYDTTRRLASTDHSSGRAPSDIDARAFTWDAVGNLTGHADTRTGPDVTYRYDPAHRLVRSQRGTEPAVAYTMDGAGNRLRVDGGGCAGTYTVDSVRNQYPATPCDVRRYDAAGDLTAVAGRTIGYDYRHQMVRHTSASGALTTYRYDALGRRVARTVSGAETRFFYDGDRVIEERDATGATTATYVHGEAPGEVLTMRRGGTDHYLYGDHLGSVTAVTDRDGRVVERYRYADFGAPTVLAPDGTPRTGGSAIGNPYLFTGARYDTETGLYQMGARHLDPVAGRFTTRDPLGVWGDPANFGNATTYAANNPATLTDRTGLSIEVDRLCTHNPPGPKHVHMEFEDMGKSQRHWTAIAGCRGWAASFRAWQAVKQLRLHLESGESLFGGSNCGGLICVSPHLFTMFAVNKWFGRGGDNGNFTTGWTRQVVEDVLYDTYDGFREDFDIEYEDDCSGNTLAYVINGPWTDVHVCKSWFQLATTLQMGAVLAHEFSHSWGGTEDYGYLNQTFASSPSVGYQNPSGNPVNLFEPSLRDNADTYMHFIFPFVPNG